MSDPKRNGKAKARRKSRAKSPGTRAGTSARADTSPTTAAPGDVDEATGPGGSATTGDELAPVGDAAPTDQDTPAGDLPRGEAPADEVISDDAPVDEVISDDAPVDETATASVSANRSVWARLYHGETNIDFVGRRRTWFAISAVLVLIGVGSFVARGGFNLGIDFEGGVVWEVPAGEATVAEVRDVVGPFGLAGSTIQELDSDEGRTIRVEAEPVEPETSDEITTTLSEVTGAPFDDVILSEVGPSWGQEVSSKALRALVVFLVLVTLYITLRFEWKMALPTLVALFHDILIVAGFYAVTQIEITPATVIALLTILGYSIYDGVVVFDKVDENTRYVSSTGGLTYGGMVNVSLNQALMRSLNTNITALLPVIALLVIGSWIMGAEVIEEFALALLVGQLSGAYSSIFIASPMLAWLKEREPRYRDIRRRIDARGGDAAAVAATIALGRPPSGRATVPATASAGASSGRSTGDPVTVAPSGRAIPPRPRKKTKRPGR